MDLRKIEEDRWIGDDVIRELGDAGLCDDLLHATAVPRTTAAVQIRTFRIIQ